MNGFSNLVICKKITTLWFSKPRNINNFFQDILALIMNRSSLSKHILECVERVVLTDMYILQNADKVKKWLYTWNILSGEAQ